MRHAILSGIVMLAYAGPVAFACESMPLKLLLVSSNLTVAVTHRDKPISGIEVLVVPENSREPVFTGSTDNLGTVHIQHLTARRYFVTVSHDDFPAGRQWIEVISVPDAKTERRLNFQWADWSYETSRAAGTLTGLVPGNTGNRLMDIARPVGTIYPGVDMTLMDTFSHVEYHTISDSSGAFLFGDVPDGIYVLTIAGGMKSVSGIADVTRQVIDLKRTTTRASLPLQLGNNGCYQIEFELIEQ